MYILLWYVRLKCKTLILRIMHYVCKALRHALRLWHELEQNGSYWKFAGPKGQGLDSDNNPALECFGVPDVVLSATIVVCSTTVLYHAVITSFA